MGNAPSIIPAGRVAPVRSRIAFLPSKPRLRRVFALVIALPLFFSVGRYIPVSAWTIDLAIAGSVILAIWSASLVRGGTLHPLNVYILAVAFLVPLMSGLSAHIAFAQPFHLGVAAQRGCLLALFAYAMGNFLAAKTITLTDFRGAMIYLAWINLGLCSAIRLLFDPNEFSQTRGLVTDGGGIFNEFILPSVFVVFGALYYVSRLTITGRPINVLLAAPFILYMALGDGGRSAILALIVSIALISWIGNPRSRASNALGIFILGTLFLSLVHVLLPERLDQFYVSFIDAISVVFGAYNVNDISANVRIIESEIAWPYVLDHPLLGTGTISAQWNGGYGGLFDYFHPADLGLLGLVFTYGLIGLIFFGCQYLWLVGSLQFASRELGRSPHSVLLLSTVALLAYLLFSSVATGLFVLNPEQTLLLFVLIRAHRSQHFFAN